MPQHKIKRTSTDKVHIAGIGADGVQRCIRCHAVIGRISYWPGGSPVLTRRHGARVVTPEEAAQFRPCGRRGPRVTVEEQGDTYAVLVDGEHHTTVSQGYFPTKAERKQEAHSLAACLRARRPTLPQAVHGFETEVK